MSSPSRFFAPHLVNQGDALRQFQRELQAITRLSHPNIIKTFDAGQDGNRHYFAMEYVEGMDLDRFVQQVGPLPRRAGLRLRPPGRPRACNTPTRTAWSIATSSRPTCS